MSADPPTGVIAQPSVPAWPFFMAGQEDQPVRVVLAEDDAHMRRVIANELLGDKRINLLAQASSLRDGKRVVNQHEFDVLLLDLNLGDGDGFDLLEHVKRQRPLSEVIVVTTIDDEERALRAFEMGATGYFVKHSWFGSYTQAVLQVVNGGASITPNLARRLLRRIDGAQEPRIRTVRFGRTHIRPEQLTGREREVLQGVAAGYTSAEVAARLGISGQTVNAHIKNIYRKLKVRSRGEAISCATSLGLLY